MVNEKDRPILLCNVDYPLYTVKVLSERHIIVAGGGGSSNTGVRNYADIFELVYDPDVDACRAVAVARLNTDKRAIMNMCIIAHSEFHFSLLTGGDGGLCQVYDVKLKIRDDNNPFPNDRSNGEAFSKPRSNSISSNISEPASHSLRKRLNSTSRSSSIDEESNCGTNNVNPSLSGQPMNGNSHSKSAFSSSPSSSQSSFDSTIPEYSFYFDPVQTFQTDFHKEAHQKLIKYSPYARLLFTAGSDLTIRIWANNDENDNWINVREIIAHQKEMDDLDIHPMGQHVISCGRDGKINVWNVNTGKLITSLTHEPVLPKIKNPKTNESTPVKYIARSLRYGTVEGDITKVRLYCLLNPLSLSSPSTGSFLSKWNVQDDKYSFVKIVRTGNFHLSSLGISDNGHFLAVGDNRGDVEVYIAFSLQRCYHVSKAHQSIFITGLEFIPTTVPSLELVGGNSEASLVSISVDNRIILHRLTKRTSFGPLSSFIFFAFFMLAIYVGMNLADL